MILLQESNDLVELQTEYEKLLLEFETHVSFSCFYAYNMWTVLLFLITNFYVLTEDNE